MAVEVAHECNEADEKILEYLAGGRDLPQNIGEDLGYSRQYVQNRLQMLKAADYVTRHGGGLYEITDVGRDEIGAAEDETAALRARLQDAIQARDAARASVDRLEDRVAELEADLAEVRGQSVDVAALERALGDIESAADRGDGQALQHALERAREAIQDE